jgi:hypothetical protein
LRTTQPRCSCSTTPPIRRRAAGAKVASVLCCALWIARLERGGGGRYHPHNTRMISQVVGRGLQVHVGACAGHGRDELRNPINRRAAQSNQLTSMDQSAGPGAEGVSCAAGRTAMTLSEYSFEYSLQQWPQCCFGNQQANVFVCVRACVYARACESQEGEGRREEGRDAGGRDREKEGEGGDGRQRSRCVHCVCVRVFTRRFRRWWQRDPGRNLRLSRKRRAGS